MITIARVTIFLAMIASPGLAQQIISTLSGSASTCTFSGDGGPASSATLCGVNSPSVDSTGTIYFVDNNRIRKITTDGTISTIAGNGQSGTSGDGGPALSATISLGFVRQTAVFGSRVCFADARALKVRCVDQNTGLMQGYGTGVSGTGGDGGNVANASFMNPTGVAFDSAGNLYISDSGANSVRRVDAVTSIITTFVGPGPGYCCVSVGDGGPALGADIYEPGQLSYFNGALYISDTGNDRIRRVDLMSGVITTAAGGGTGTGSGIPAVSASIVPGDITLDNAGNLFLTSQNMVWKVDTSGIITVIAGTGMSGSGLDYVPATQTTFGGITGLAWDSVANRLLIGDFETRLRQLFYTPATATTLTLSPNPVVPQGQVSLQASVSPLSATGNVLFYQDTVQPGSGLIVGTTLLGTAPVTNGAAATTWTAPMSSSSCGYGSCGLRAVYGGDPADNLSSSGTLVEGIQQGTTTTTFTSSANPSVAGQSVTFTATVTPSGATGVIFLSNGSTQIGTYTLANGTVTFSISNLAVGSSTLSAKYSGSFAYSSSTATLTQLVQNSTTTTLTSSGSPSVYATPVTLTATVSPNTATGTVQFFNAGTLLGSTNLTNGQAQLTVSALPGGTDSLTAVYGGDTNDAGSTSGVLAQTVSQASSTASLTANPTSGSTAGQNVVFTATVTPAGATGTVQFWDSANSLGSVAVGGGTAMLATSALAVGVHSITATYSGDGNYAGSGSGILNFTVSKVSTTVAVSSAPNPSVAGGAVGFTATVVPAAAIGTVQFLDGTTVFGSATLSGGTASLSLSTLAVGSHSITVVYGGDANNAGSTSGMLTQTVNKVTTSTAISSSPNPASVGQTVAFTASVTPNSATGSIQILDGATVVGTGTINGVSATVPVSGLAAGSHSITAVYGGDANNAGSTSGVLTQTVNKVTTSTAISSSLNPASIGQTVAFTAAVTPNSATGGVQFLDGATVVGTGTINGGSATVSVSGLAVGSHSITAVYGGDANNASSTSNLLTQTVNKTVTATTLTSSLNPATSGQAIVFTASVSPGTATGSVQFLDGSTVLGTVTVNSGTAAYSTSTLSVGTHSITAVYSGDANDAGSSSAMKTETVNAALPGAPSSLAASAASASQINLNWVASPTGGVTYNVYASTSSSFTPASSNRVASGVGGTSYSNTGLSASTTYYYVVTAVNSNGESSTSNQAHATTSAASSISCHVVYSVTTQWNVGFGTALTIQNTGKSAINGWTLSWTWANNQQITQSWNANYTQTGANAKLTNASWNNVISPGTTVSGIGFNGSYSGTNTAPTAFYLNGTLCQ